MTAKVWESQSKARIIHYESKQKKTVYSPFLFPRKSGEKVHLLCCMNFSVLL